MVVVQAAVRYCPAAQDVVQVLQADFAPKFTCGQQWPCNAFGSLDTDVHDDAPDSGWNVPAAQGEHDVMVLAPALNEPGAH